MIRASHNTRFTRDDILNILRLGREGHFARTVAGAYGVAPETIRKIWRGETFREITGGGIERFETSRAVDQPITETLRSEGNPLYQDPPPEAVAESLSRLRADLSELTPGENASDKALDELERRAGGKPEKEPKA